MIPALLVLWKKKRFSLVRHEIAKMAWKKNSIKKTFKNRGHLHKMNVIWDLRHM